MTEYKFERGVPLPPERMGDTATLQLKVRLKKHQHGPLVRAARHHGVSLNAEITRRLEESLEPGFVRDTNQVVHDLADTTLKLHNLQAKILDLAHQLEQPEHQRSAIEIARSVAEMHKVIYSVAKVLEPQEQNK